MKIARASGDGWSTFDSGWHGPFKTKAEAKKVMRGLYPDHIWVFVLPLNGPEKRSPKGQSESV